MFIEKQLITFNPHSVKLLSVLAVLPEEFYAELFPLLKYAKAVGYREGENTFRDCIPTVMHMIENNPDSARKFADLYAEKYLNPFKVTWEESFLSKEIKLAPPVPTFDPEELKKYLRASTMAPAILYLNSFEMSPQEIAKELNVDTKFLYVLQTGSVVLSHEAINEGKNAIFEALKENKIGFDGYDSIGYDPLYFDAPAQSQCGWIAEFSDDTSDLIGFGSVGGDFLEEILEGIQNIGKQFKKELRAKS